MKALKSKTNPIKLLAVLFIVIFSSFAISGSMSSSPTNSLCQPEAIHCVSGARLVSTTCGAAPNTPVVTSINFGCQSKGNPITDIIFAVIRFLSTGVGIVIVGSIVVGGLQYIGARGDPQSTSIAIGRIRSAIIALIIFIFAYAILNYLIPAGFFK